MAEVRFFRTICGFLGFVVGNSPGSPRFSWTSLLTPSLVAAYV